MIEKEITAKEMQKMNDADFNAVSPFQKQSCADCGHLKQALSLWCGNEEAIKARGTRIPGVIKCHFWKPDWSQIPKKYRTKEYGYIERKLLNTPIIKKNGLINRLSKQFIEFFKK